MSAGHLQCGKHMFTPLWFSLCFFCSPASVSSLCFHLVFCPSFSTFFAPLCLLLALHRLKQHRIRARVPESPAPRSGLARCGAGDGGILRERGERAGLQSSQRATVQHGPGPAARSQTTNHAPHWQGEHLTVWAHLSVGDLSKIVSEKTELQFISSTFRKIGITFWWRLKPSIQTVTV